MTRPTFQRRHYEQIAQALQDVAPSADARSHALIVKSIANMLARDNGEFKRGRFELACEPGANVRARA